MASQSPRLENPTPQREFPNRNPRSPARTRVHPRITEADLLELAYGIPSLHASPGTTSPSNSASLHIRPTSKHGRSMSHPFPAILQSKQKRQGVNDPGTADLSGWDNHSLLTQNQS